MTYKKLPMVIIHGEAALFMLRYFRMVQARGPASEKALGVVLKDLERALDEVGIPYEEPPSKVS